MNKLSKLTALLLALVLALGVPLQVVAESIVTLPRYEEEVSAILQKLYETLMQSTTYDEVLEATKTMTRTEIENFLNRLIADTPELDLDAYDAHIQELFVEYLKSKIFPLSAVYTNVGPFLNYYSSEDARNATTFSLMSRAASSTTTTTKTTTANGLTTTKTVEWNQDENKGTITIEAYSTGATVQTQLEFSPPLDIVLVIDQSKSMTDTKKYIPGNQVTGNLDTSKKYWTQTDGNWVEVSWCSTCNDWTYGCEDKTTKHTAGTKIDDITQFYESISRKAALIPAVQQFVDSVCSSAKGTDAQLNTADDAAHRIAFVGFESSTYIYTGDGVTTSNAGGAFIELDTTDGQTTANAIVDNNTEMGENTAYLWHNKTGTNTASGLQTAYNILLNNPLPDYSNLTGNDLTEADLDGNGKVDEYEKRKRVVILFTDGEPQDDASTGVLNAYYIKNLADGPTVYTIGVVDSADPSLDFTAEDAPTEGTGKKAVNVNKYLHYISSNYPQAKSMDDTYYDANAQGYYLAAKSSGELSVIFQKIAGNINSNGGTIVKLTEESTVVDVLTDTFQLPEGASSVRVYVASVNDATGTTPTFDDPVLVYGTETAEDGTTTTASDERYQPTISEDGKSISVSGFDFSENWVGTVTDVNGNTTTRTEGKKLIIEIDIEPVDGFLGGNDVETNVVEDSGILDDDGASVMPLPDPDNVDVELWRILVNGKHQHLFLSNEADLNELLQSFSLTYTKADGTVSYEVDGTRNDYATLVFSLKAASGKSMRYVIQPGDTVGVWEYYNEAGEKVSEADSIDVTPFLTADTTTYNISYEVIPKTEGTYEKTSGSLDVGVHVYKPTFTFQDTTEEYLSTETSTAYYDTYNRVATETWTHTYEGEITVTITVEYDDGGTPTYSYVVTKKDGTQIAEDTDWEIQKETIDFSGYGSTEGVPYYVKMSGEKPDVSFTYSPEQTDWIDENSQVTAVECVDVNVTAVTLTSTNTHEKVVLDSNGAVTDDTEPYKTTSVYTEGSGTASVTITKDGTTSDPTILTPGHIKTNRVADACTACGTNDGAISDTNINDSEMQEFVVHIKNAYSELLITKSGLNVGESAIFTVTGYVPDGTANGEKQTWTIVLTATEDNRTPSATITGLLVNSTATVKESGDWSWRYSKTTYSPDDATVTIVPKTSTDYPATVTITNSGRTDQWLSDESNVHNDFSKDGTYSSAD